MEGVTARLKLRWIGREFKSWIHPDFIKYAMPPPTLVNSCATVYF